MTHSRGNGGIIINIIIFHLIIVCVVMWPNFSQFDCGMGVTPACHPTPNIGCINVACHPTVEIRSSTRLNQRSVQVTRCYFIV